MTLAEVLYALYFLGLLILFNATIEVTTDIDEGACVFCSSTLVLTIMLSSEQSACRTGALALAAVRTARTLFDWVRWHCIAVHDCCRYSSAERILLARRENI